MSVNVLKDMRKQITQQIATSVSLCAWTVVSMECAHNHTLAHVCMDTGYVMNLITIHVILYVLKDVSMETAWNLVHVSVSVDMLWTQTAKLVCLCVQEVV
jgi:hypothetical protein